MKESKILDCTLRDGGYYNNWDFPKDLVDNYLSTMSKIGVDYVELGFRSFEKKGFRGPNWYTTESYLNSLVIPKNINVSVMVNASEFVLHPLGHLKATKLMLTALSISSIHIKITIILVRTKNPKRPMLNKILLRINTYS